MGPFLTEALLSKILQISPDFVYHNSLRFAAVRFGYSWLFPTLLLDLFGRFLRGVLFEDIFNRFLEEFVLAESAFAGENFEPLNEVLFHSGVIAGFWHKDMVTEKNREVNKKKT